jgi:nucleoside permease NupC
MAAAANIFVGLLEAPLLIKPFLNDLTNSELNAVMTAG